MAGLRITGGVWRGRRVDGDAGIRPTTEKVRLALFSIWGPRVEACRFLDLFSGSGVVGLEAASRAASSVVFVDSLPRALRRVEANCRRLAFEAQEIRRGSVPGALSALARSACAPFDLVFADPPYRFSAYTELIAGTAALLDRHGELAVEHSARRTLSERGGDLVQVDMRRYGETALSFYRLADEG